MWVRSKTDDPDIFIERGRYYQVAREFIRNGTRWYDLIVDVYPNMRFAAPSILFDEVDSTKTRVRRRVGW